MCWDLMDTIVNAPYVTLLVLSQDSERESLWAGQGSQLQKPGASCSVRGYVNLCV